MSAAPPSKTERIDVRASSPVKQLLQEAARTAHKNVSEFLLDAGIAAANQTLADRPRRGVGRQRLLAHPMTAIDPGIFKAYDIRGLYPSQLDAGVARRVARAFVDYLGARRVAVGRDCRFSSPELAAAFVEGACSQGASVTDIGVVGTDVLYYHVARHDLGGGAIVTASHNPKEWNGIKMVTRGALALSGDAGIKEIREWVAAGRYADRPPATGERRTATTLEDYAPHCLSFVDLRAIPPLKVVLHTANGMGAVGAAAIFGHLPVDTVRMYFELDGTFPNHPADPLLEENRPDFARSRRARPKRPGTATR